MTLTQNEQITTVCLKHHIFVLSKNKTGDNLALLNQYLQLMSAHTGGMKASYC